MFHIALTSMSNDPTQKLAAIDVRELKNELGLQGRILDIELLKQIEDFRQYGNDAPKLYTKLFRSLWANLFLNHQVRPR